MNPKHFEYIVVYLSILVVCVLIGALARIIAVGAGVDEFTANIVFWSVTALGDCLCCAKLAYRRTVLGYTTEVFPKSHSLKPQKSLPFRLKVWKKFEANKTK